MAESLHPKVDQRVSVGQLEFVIRHMMRNPEIFIAAKRLLKPTIFYSSTEGHYKLLWETALAVEASNKLSYLCDSDGSVPYTLMYQIIAGRCDNEPELLTTEQRAHLLGTPGVNGGLLYWIFYEPINRLNPVQASRWLQLFLQERTVQLPLLLKLENAEHGVITDMVDILQKAREQAVILCNIAHDPVVCGAPIGYKLKKLFRRKFNMPWLEICLGGGMVNTEVYGCLGGYGSGKTVLAVMIVANAALAWQREADELTMETGEPHYPDECFLFHYEANREEVFTRLWSSFASVPHERISQLDREEWSTSADLSTLLPYEKELFKHQWGNTAASVMGEQERLAAIEPALRRNLWLIDMSASQDDPDLGYGYIPEIRGIVASHLRKLDLEHAEKVLQGVVAPRPPHKCGLIVIDYAGLCIWKYMTKNNLSIDKELRHLVTRFPTQCRDDLAAPFDCPVWVFHQLSGEANAAVPHRVQHFTAAAESKSFAENVHFCFALGIKDTDTSNLLFATSKARRDKVHVPPVLMLQGEFFRLVLSNTHVYDKDTKKIVPKAIFDDNLPSLCTGPPKQSQNVDASDNPNVLG